MTSLPFLLFWLFLALKLAGVIAWSWWFVFAPLIATAVVGFFEFVAIGFGLWFVGNRS